MFYTVNVKFFLANCSCHPCWDKLGKTRYQTKIVRETSSTEVEVVLTQNVSILNATVRKYPAFSGKSWKIDFFIFCP